MQYSKFMANLYKYDENIQREISGVARFENIGKNIKLGVKLCFTKRENGELKVFIIKKSGRIISGKLIFEGKIRQRVFTMQKIITEEDMGIMGCRAGDIKGVYIIFNENRKYAAFWEADKIDINKIDITIDEEIKAADTVDRKVSNSVKEITDNQENDNQINNISNSDNSESEADNEDNIEESLQQNNDNNTIKDSENNSDKESSDLSATELEQEKTREEVEVQGEKVNLMRLRELPKKAWKLGNNSFLLHGYYNYHYIYLKKEKHRWIVGVPGVYYPQEEKIAAIFGFRKFMAVSADEKKKGVFGYWCKSVEISE